ncbi:MAG: PSD1 and planctomycete cytochrome C domain-containing protein [Pirellulaceae bacterium]
MTRAVQFLQLSFRLTLLVGLLPNPSASALGADIDFAHDIRPLLSENCFFCHGQDEEHREADLRLDTEEGLAQVITAGDHTESELVRRLLSSDPDEAMPPPDSNRHISAAQAELIARWIDEGAEWQTHWAFSKLVAPPIPAQPSDATALRRNAIDAFVQAKLVESGLSPSPEAERATLIRRLSLDLTGLPPTPAAVAAFVADPDQGAYERVVDRLLDSPAYGQRMAWDWLDAARYADTNGYQGDGERTMWPWRDWVVNAFDKNMPFDQFTVWQLAGDLLPEATDEQKLATGFLRNHMINGEGGRIAEENRIEYNFDMSETTGTVWLGLTMNCCRCHDHKYDPLTNRDYYSLVAYFDQTPVTGAGGNPQTPPLVSWPSAEQKSKDEELKAAINEQRAALALISATVAERPPRPRTKLTDSTLPLCVTGLPEYQEAKQRLDVLQNEQQGLEKQIPKVMVMQDLPTPRKSFMLARGLYSQPTQEVTPAPPAFLPQRASSHGTDEPQNRLALARWIIAPENPLTARVTVNRMWQQFFGIGLVKTSEDFGVQGENPRQLELLNWLAADFRDNGWDVKRLVRLIVTSHTYRQSSRQTPEQAGEDPQNRWLARGSRFRLPSWMLRDQALAASGLLSPIVAGPGVNTYQPSGVWEEATFGKKTYKLGTGEQLYRRSLFIFWRRIVAPTVFFDTATRQTCTVKTARTNTPLQSLLMLNDTTYVEAARTLAQAALRSDASDDTQRLNFAMQRVLARDASPAEQEVLLAALQRNLHLFDAQADPLEILSVGQSPRAGELDAKLHASWTVICLAILNLDETLNHE